MIWVSGCSELGTRRGAATNGHTPALAAHTPRPGEEVNNYPTG
jgi:hypothetical protein